MVTRRDRLRLLTLRDTEPPEFTEYCATEAADKAVIDGALAMAWTAIDIVTDEGVRERLLSA